MVVLLHFCCSVLCATWLYLYQYGNVGMDWSLGQDSPLLERVCQCEIG